MMGIRNINALKGDDIPTNSVNPCPNLQPHNGHEWGEKGKIYNCPGRE